MAIIRISGENSFNIIDKIFLSVKETKVVQAKGYSVLFGSITDGDELIDEVLLNVYKNPKSYTGENSVEIFCHGSAYIQNKILQLLIKSGARIAEPGEFTMRSFLNGKMDLSQAEAVADVISASSKSAHKLAMDQMRGGFSLEIKKMRQELLNFVSLLELELDFSEEEVEFADRKQLNILIDKIDRIVKNLVGSFELGNAIKNGIPITIIGEPNVGKSTLLNVLLNENKAIVSEIPGTTRDVVEDVITLNGVQFRFIDTAGIRQTNDTVETLGIKKTYEKIAQARIVLLLVDVSKQIDIIKEQIGNIKERIDEQQELLVLCNKIDVSEENNKIILNELEEIIPLENVCFISAKENINIDHIHTKIKELSQLSVLDGNDIIVTNARHYQSLVKVDEGLVRIKTGLSEGLSNDFIAQDAREIMFYLGEITGDITPDDILGNIFANFCIGK